MELGQKYRILDSVTMKKPRSFSEPDIAKEGWLCFYKEFLATDVNLLLDPFIVRIFWHNKLCPTQLLPNAWRHIVGFVSLDLFYNCYYF